MRTDEWKRRLEASFRLFLSGPCNLDRIVGAFQPLLKDVFFHKDAERLEQVRQFARAAFEQMPQHGGIVSLEVRHMCWHLQHLGEPGFGTSSVIDMVVVTKGGMAGYREHPRSRCKICADYPDDPWLTKPGSKEVGSA